MVVFLHFGWNATIDERREARTADDEIGRRLEAIGGKTSKSWSSEHGYVATLIKSKATDSDLVVLKEFTMMNKLNLSGSSILMKGSRILHTLRRSINLTSVIQASPMLAWLICADVVIEEELNVGSTQVTDKTLDSLQGLADVKRVLLADTRIAGPGLQRLRACRQLFDLDLRNTPIFDDDLPFSKVFPDGQMESRRASMAWLLRGSGSIFRGPTFLTLNATGLANCPVWTVLDDYTGKLKQDSAHDVLRLGINDATAINDKHQVVGWNSDGLRNGVTVRRAVLVNPHDADGDGRPDTYLRDSNQDGMNDQLVELGTFRNWDGRGARHGHQQPRTDHRLLRQQGIAKK